MTDAVETVFWDESRFAAALQQLRAGGVLDATGQRISSERLRQIVDAARAVSHERPLFKEARFDRAIFRGDADFSGVTFGDALFNQARFLGEALFENARFTGDTRFDDATFHRQAGFQNATFFHDARFVGATFHRDAWFGEAIFKGHAGFGEATEDDLARSMAAAMGDRARSGESIDGGEDKLARATFKAGAWFGGATFEREAGFGGVTFEREAAFDEVKFHGDAQFVGGTFDDLAWFEGVTIKGTAWFIDRTFADVAVFEGATFIGDARFDKAKLKDEARFKEATFKHDASFKEADLKAVFRFGSMLVEGMLVVDGASFGDVEMRVSTPKLSCQRTRFHGPAHLKIRRAEIQLDEAVFERASTLALLREWDGPGGSKPPPCGQRPAHHEPAMPCLASVSRADVANLMLAEIDLARCRFEGALGLDGLRLATPCPFDAAPTATPYTGVAFPFKRRWTKRDTIYEERQWRLTTRKREDWAAESTTHDQTQTSAPEIGRTAAGTRLRADPEELAKVYRALRKGREDEKDTPGAADFYYGEMEMRRNGARVFSWEHFVLWLYWLVSGYGLRASRALTFLAITVAGGAALLAVVGFRHGETYDPPYDSSYWWALLLAMESAISLSRAPQVKLTSYGEIVQIGLMILGPLFVGLALLSLRGRIKR
jgi:uncharacterized protein YjbI with pentapeptide repeats